MAQRRQLHDKYFKLAKAEGYLARSAYKLIEIQKRYRILRAGHYVIDLGCAPGSWLQVTSEIVGEKGRVLGVDLQTVDAPMPVNVRTIQGDAFGEDPGGLVEALGGQADVLLSDMAPNTSGHDDDLLSARLCRRVLEVVPSLLRPGGALAMKVLEGGEYPALLTECRALFRAVKGLKPDSSRSVSCEIFIICEGFKGTP